MTTGTSELRSTWRTSTHAPGKPFRPGDADVVLGEGVDGRRAHVAAEQGDVDEGERDDWAARARGVGEHPCRPSPPGAPRGETRALRWRARR